MSEGDAEGPAAVAAQLLEIARRRPVLIADGHHRYETALRYRDERRMTRSCEEDPAFDYLLMLFLSTAEALTVLPTHRIVRDLPAEGTGFLAKAAQRFEVTATDGDALRREFDAAALAPGGRGRIGLWTREGGAILQARDAGAESTASAGDGGARPGPAKRLDVGLVQSALESLARDRCGGDRVGPARLHALGVATRMDAVDRSH